MIPVRLGLSAFYLAGSLCLVAQSNPPKLASQTRIDLFASAPVEALTSARILLGDGSIARQTWRPISEHPRTYSIHLPVVRFAWTEFSIRFTPQKSGSVSLSLMGPWEEVEAGSGNIYKQEVFWDALEATGTSLPNGSFESTTSSGGATGWSGGISQSTSSSLPAADGHRFLRVWHDQPASRLIFVSGGVPVTLRFFCRAVVPAGFPEMRQISSTDTPAHQASLRFMRGINFGNWLEAAPGTFDIHYTEEDFALAKAHGFDHVRLPVAWHLHTGPGPSFPISSTAFENVDWVLDQTVRHGLNLIIDLHHFHAFTSSPATHLNEFKAIWAQVAAHYQNAPDSVAFELLNEPKDALGSSLLNSAHAEVIQLIRQSNPHRTLFVGTANFNSADELSSLFLPDDDENLITTLHIYDPFLFTHQGASWTGSETATLGVVYPGPPPSPKTPHPQANQSWVHEWFQNYNSLPPEINPSSPIAFRSKIQRIAQWAQHYGRPVHIGEFGCFETADPVSRVNFYRDIRREMDAAGIGWAMWDWKAGFHYIRNGSPQPAGMQSAIFPAPQLHPVAPGILQLQAARGKILQIQRTEELARPVQWMDIATETLPSPQVQFEDPTPLPAPAAFYRVQWLR